MTIDSPSWGVRQRSPPSSSKLNYGRIDFQSVIGQIGNAIGPSKILQSQTVPVCLPMSETIISVRQVFIDQLRDLYSAETQITKALPKLAKAASAPALKEGFRHHLEQTKKHVERIEALCSALQEKPTGKKCAATAGLVEEGQDAIDEDATPEAKDLLLIAAAQRVEHYEIAAYTSAISLAKSLGLKAAVTTLTATLTEEIATDKKLAAANKPALGKAVKSGNEDAKLGESPTSKTFVRTARRLAKEVGFKSPV